MAIYNHMWNLFDVPASALAPGGGQDPFRDPIVPGAQEPVLTRLCEDACVPQGASDGAAMCGWKVSELLGHVRHRVAGTGENEGEFGARCRGARERPDEGPLLI